MKKEEGGKFPKYETFTDPLPDVKYGSLIQFFKVTQKLDIDNNDITGLWDVFKIQHLTGENYYPNSNKIFNHFFNWAKLQKIIKHGQSNSNGSGARKSKQPTADDYRDFINS